MIKFIDEVNVTQLPTYTKASIIVIPHLDDEVFMFGSYLAEYEGKLILVFTHPSDTISDERFKVQLGYLTKCISEVEQLRTSRGYVDPVIDVYINDKCNFNGIPTESYKNVLHLIESLFNSVKLIDTYGYSIKSSHQSHTESNNICNSILRSPFIEKIKCVLLGTYTQALFSPCEWKSEDKNYNTFHPVSKIGVELLCHLINDVYGEKNPNGSLLGADALRTELKYYGLASGYEYAQPFICKRLCFRLENKLNEVN